MSLLVLAMLAQARYCDGAVCVGSSATQIDLGNRVSVGRDSSHSALVCPAQPATSLSILGNQVESSSAPDLMLGSLNTRTGTGSRLISVRSGPTEKFYITGDGDTGAPDAGITARRFIGTEGDPNATWMGNLDAGRPGSFMCPYVTNGSPCLSNPVGIIELYGRMPDKDNSNLNICDVELYGGGANVTRTAGCIHGVGNGPTSHKLWGVKYNGATFQDGDLLLDYQGGNETHIQARYAGLQLMGTHPGAGPDVYYLNGATRATGNVYEFYNAPSTLLFAIAFDGTLNVTSAKNTGTCTLDGASPSKCTATVRAGANCSCSLKGTGVPTACGWNVVGTTATFYGANGLTSVVGYTCL